MRNLFLPVIPRKFGPLVSYVSEQNSRSNSLLTKSSLSLIPLFFTGEGSHLHYICKTVWCRLNCQTVRHFATRGDLSTIYLFMHSLFIYTKVWKLSTFLWFIHSIINSWVISVYFQLLFFECQYGPEYLFTCEWLWIQLNDRHLALIFSPPYSHILVLESYRNDCNEFGLVQNCEFTEAYLRSLRMQKCLVLHFSTPL